MTRDGARPLLSPLAWTLYIALPVAGWGWLDGLPLGWVEAAAIALVWWTWAGDRRLPGGAALAGLAVAKIAFGAVLVSGGFTARYYANDAWMPPVEPSTEFRRSDITRVDERLAFGGPDQPDLPLHFLNSIRFNYYQSTEPQREQLAYSAVWDGFIRGDNAAHSFYLAAPDGARGDLTIDGRPAIALPSRGAGPSDPPEQTGDMTLATGWHSIAVRISAPYGSGRQLEAGEVVDGVRHPFDGTRVRAAPVSTTRLFVDAGIRWLARGIDLVVLSSLGLLVVMGATKAWRAIRIGRLLWLAAIAEAVLFALPHFGRATMLTGGDDWLMYEHLARAIVTDPLLQQPGLGAGQGGPLYFQVLYPYFIALTHLAFGDGIFGVVLVQRLLLAASVGWAAAITTRLFGEKIGWIAIVGGAFVLYAKAHRWSAVLLGESLFMPLLVCWTWLLVRTATEPPAWPRLVLTGVIGGTATLVRSTLVLALPLVMPVWTASLRTRRLRSVVIVIASTFAVLGLLTARTWIVSRTIVVLPSSGGVALSVGNAPSSPLAPEPPERAEFYERLKLSAPTRAVVEFAAQDPAAFLANLGRKALYAAGLFALSGIEAVGTSVPAISLVYVGMWAAALAGIYRLTRSPAHPPWAVVALPGVVAFSHVAAVVAVLPNQYGDRLILPLYPLLIPYAAYGVDPLVSLVRRTISPMAPWLMAALALAIFLPATDRASDLVIVLVIVATLMALASGGKWSSTAWLFVAFALTHIGDRDFGHYLLLPMTVFAVARLAAAHVTRRMILAALLMGPLFGASIGGRTVMTDATDPAGWARGIAGQLDDARRDLVSVTGGSAEARQDLMEDTRDVARDIARPFVDVASVLTNNFAGFSMLCLLAIVMHLVGRGPIYVVDGVVLVALTLSLIGPTPPVWDGNGYSLAALAILFGLADATRVNATAP